MTVDELQQATRDLERDLKNTMRNYEMATGCRVTEVRITEEGPGVADMELEVRIDPLPYPSRLPNAEVF